MYKTDRRIDMGFCLGFELGLYFWRWALLCAHLLKKIYGGGHLKGQLKATAFVNSPFLEAIVLRR